MRTILLSAIVALPSLAIGQTATELALMERVAALEAQLPRRPAAQAVPHITPEEVIAVGGREGAIRMLEQQRGIPASRSIVPRRVTVRHEYPFGQRPAHGRCDGGIFRYSPR